MNDKPSMAIADLAAKICVLATGDAINYVRKSNPILIVRVEDMLQSFSETGRGSDAITIRLLREQIRVSDVAYNNLQKRFMELEGRVANALL